MWGDLASGSPYPQQPDIRFPRELRSQVSLLLFHLTKLCRMF